MSNESKRHVATRRVSTTVQTPTAFCIHRAGQRERISFRTSPRVRFLPSFRQLAGEITQHRDKGDASVTRVRGQDALQISMIVSQAVVKPVQGVLEFRSAELQNVISSEG